MSDDRPVPFPVPGHLTADERRVWDAAAELYDGHPVRDTDLADWVGWTVWTVRAIVAPLRAMRSWPFGRACDLVERAADYDPDPEAIALDAAAARLAALNVAGIWLQECRPDPRGPRLISNDRFCRRLVRHWRRRRRQGVAR